MEKIKILLSGGGTGGHTIPLVAVAEELQKQSLLLNQQIELLWVGEVNSQEEKIAQKFKIKFHGIKVGKIRRYFSIKNFFDLFKIPVGILKAYQILKHFSPKAIFSKGGYVSTPVLFVAKILKIPFFIHESDSIPGITNLFFSKGAKKIFISFNNSIKYFKKYNQNIVLTGVPIRREILHGNKKRGYRLFGLEYGRPVILFLGGSQGAVKINDLVLKTQRILLKKYQIIHLVGEKNFKEFAAKFRHQYSKNPSKTNQKIKNYYHFFPSLEGIKLADAMTCADLVVSRAGASTIFELAALARPTILIPYPYSAANHQMKNAQILEKEQAAKVILEEKLNEDIFIKQINDLLSDEMMQHRLSQNIFEKFGKLSLVAAQKIVHEILDN